ncbi:MAG TPA: ATP synthase F1 subunit delta [Solirubrobacteraceae bacterium]|nr:ATP synthase F1 subunit delta [Solirubrobacteraceae bacterium]
MEEIAQVYARSLFEVASEQNKLDTIKEQLGEFADALAGNREFAVFFFSPYFSVEEKKDGLRRAVEGADPIFANFLEALLERHRMPAIYRIRTEFETLYDKTNKLLPVQVTSAIELDSELVASLGRRIGEQTGNQIELSTNIDPEILGGIVLRVGNFILDASIKTRLEQLRREVAQA